MGADRVEELTGWEEHLDRAAEEVFSMMVGVGCAHSQDAPGTEPEMISAVVGLAGALSGSFVLRVGRNAAALIAERMTGAAADSATIRDAVGEVCNMLAGAWKGKDAKLSSGCLLSTPTTVAGDHYELFSQRAPMRIEHAYRFEDQMFSVSLFCATPF